MSLKNKSITQRRHLLCCASSTFHRTATRAVKLVAIVPAPPKFSRILMTSTGSTVQAGSMFIRRHSARGVRSRIPSINRPAGSLINTTMSTAPQGLVLILAENGPAIADDRFNDWYNNEHAPARLTVPGYITATRYQATDSQKPTYLTVYDISSPDVADCPEFQALKHKASDNEKDIMPKIQFLSRRIYQTIGTFAHPASVPSSFPGKYVLTAELEVKPEFEEEFNKWYNEEHMGLLKKVPGWLRGRRYSLVTSTGRGEAVGKPVFKYLAVHDFDNGDFLKTPEWAAAIDTPWRTKVMEGVLGMEVRQFELNKIMEKPL